MGPTPLPPSPTQPPTAPTAGHPTPSPVITSTPTPATAEPTPSPSPSPSTSPAPTLEHLAPPPPTPTLPTPATVQATPSPPTLVACRTVLAEAANAGDKKIQVEDVTGLAAGMSLTIADDTNSETRIIVALVEGSGRRLAAGSVTLDVALENSY